MIGLERAPDPFDPAPLAEHLRAVLAPPFAIQFGGFVPSDRRMLSRGLPLHDRTFGLRDGRAVLMGWPIVDGDPCSDLADVRAGCAALGVTHRYGHDPDVYLVVGDLVAVPSERLGALEEAVRAELAREAVRVRLSVRRPLARDVRRPGAAADVVDVAAPGGWSGAEVGVRGGPVHGHQRDHDGADVQRPDQDDHPGQRVGRREEGRGGPTGQHPGSRFPQQ